MTIQTRSMTQRAIQGEPHDLEAFNSYADPNFQFQLPVKKQLRFREPYTDEDFPSDDEDFPSDDEDDRSWLEGEPFEEDSEEDSANQPEPFDESHFCPSWNKCCEDNLAAKSLPPPPAPPTRWPENLDTFREVFTRSQWRDYIGEICHGLSYTDADDEQLTQEEYAAAHAFMHGNL